MKRIVIFSLMAGLLLITACKKEVTITVKSNNESWGKVTGGGTYAKGTEITLKATPTMSTYKFVKWEDGNTDNPRKIVVKNNATYTAVFDVENVEMCTITVLSNDTNLGTVSGAGSYMKGAQIELKATAKNNMLYRFVKWEDGNTDNPRRVVVETNASYKACFELRGAGNAIVTALLTNMVKVHGGTFQMGAANGDTGAYDKDKPQHSVTVSDFYMCKYEVTQELWQTVMGSIPSGEAAWTDNKGKGSKYPAYNITWQECQTFIAKLNEMTGLHFRLPTEAEWEYAARGGQSSQGYLYAGSNTLNNVAWYGNNSSDKTHEVMKKSPNELGLYDMTGNVAEYCSDWFENYTSAAQTNPTGPASGTVRVRRGASYSITFAKNCRITCRSTREPNVYSSTDGFRLVAPIE